MISSRLAVALMIVALPAHAVAAAQAPQTPPPPQQNGARSNLNEIVCEKIETIGSRLGSKRVCLTRAQWAERRRDDRATTEKAQIARPLEGN